MHLITTLLVASLLTLNVWSQKITSCSGTTTCLQNGGGTTVCAANSVCTITCSNCDNTIIIDATQATTFTLNCVGSSESGGCPDAIVNATSVDDVTINCQTTNSCNRLQLTSHENQHFKYTVSASSAGENAVIKAQNAIQYTIGCGAQENGCWFTEFHFRGTKTQSFNLDCTAASSCSNMILHLPTYKKKNHFHK